MHFWEKTTALTQLWDLARKLLYLQKDNGPERAKKMSQVFMDLGAAWILSAPSC
jgi:hypothetical protein